MALCRAGFVAPALPAATRAPPLPTDHEEGGAGTSGGGRAGGGGDDDDGDDDGGDGGGDVSAARPRCPRYTLCTSDEGCVDVAGAGAVCVRPAAGGCTRGACRQMAVRGCGCVPAGACTKDCRQMGYCSPAFC